MTDDEEMREIIRFAEHKFVIRLDGQQVVALVATIDLACRHPNFRGPTRLIAEMIAEHLRRIAKHEAPELDLVQSVCNINWISHSADDGIVSARSRRIPMKSNAEEPSLTGLPEDAPGPL